MGIMEYSVFWVMQDLYLYHQPYKYGFKGLYRVRV